MNKYKHNFGFGDTKGIREIFLKHASFLQNLHNPWENYGYPEHGGDPELIEEVRKYLCKSLGLTYKYIIITNGATNGINAYIHAKKEELHKYPLCGIVTHKLYFPFYSKIAKIHELAHNKMDIVRDLAVNEIGIIDHPSNPKGILTIGGQSKNILFDAAYYSPTYCGTYRNGKLVLPKVIPDHDAMVGSMAKLTGINGLRIGFFATNNESIYENALEYITTDLCGVSSLSQFTSIQILKKTNFDLFYEESKNMLDLNKEELSRLDYLFGNQDIPTNGMFALFEVDSKIKKLLEKARVQTIPGNMVGDDRDSIRINLANSYRDTRSMVVDILKIDKKFN